MGEASKELVLSIRMYKLLLGSLSRGRIRKLQDELKARYESNQTNSALELKIYTALITNNGRPTRRYLIELLDDWEKRTAGTIS